MQTEFTHPEEAVLDNLARAEAMRRKRENAGKWSAFVITVAVHAIAIMILALIVLPALQVDVPKFRGIPMPLVDEPKDPWIPRTTVRSRPPSTSSQPDFINTHSSNARISIPTQPAETSVADIGIGTMLGLGIGPAGPGDGQDNLVSLPPGIRGRCTQQERLKLLREGGGNEVCEQAVLKSLRWLKSTQNSDGSWGRQYKCAMTGLAILAYLGHCETPRSTEFGETVTRGITFLVNTGNARNGTISLVGGHQFVYEHAIATYALCEALTFTKELRMEFPGLREAADQAVKVILNGQNPSGSWDYGYNTTSKRPGDTSILGWHVQALKAAYHAGFDKNDIDKAMDRALKRLEEIQADDGTFGYTHKASTGMRLVGVGALAYQMWGKENHKVARNALRYMTKNAEPVYASADANLYAWYYTTLSLFQRGGNHWEQWNKKWRDQILNHQNNDGTWKPEGAIGGGGGGHLSTNGAGRDADLYRVCLNTLSLEVYYRFLPGTGGAK